MEIVILGFLETFTLIVIYPIRFDPLLVLDFGRDINNGGLKWIKAQYTLLVNEEEGG